MTTSLLVSVVLQNKRQGFRVNNGDTVMNELINALQPLRQKFPVTEDPVHRNRALIKYRTLQRQVETAREFSEWIWLEKMERDNGLGINRVCGT